MPTNLLFPLLVLALVLNAALVAVAVRQLAAERRREAARRVAPRTAAVSGGEARLHRAGPRPPVVSGGVAAGSPTAAAPEATAAATATNTPAAPEATAVTATAEPRAPDTPTTHGTPETPDTPDTPETPDTPVTPTTPAARSRRAARPRRFTLPPLGEDRERADRAIELFLSGGRTDLPPHPHPAPVAGAATTDRRAEPGPEGRTASVAIVAIAGFRSLAATAGPAQARAVANAVEETLRRSARADDHVVGLEDGRFRILLVGSSEHAATVYLDRVRAACSPWLAAAGTPLDLVTASAQAGPDGDLGRALRTAERRLVRAAGGADVPRDERA